jgi:DNA-binding response OmpR family regulator
MSTPFALIIEDDPKLGSIFTTALSAIGFETGLDPDGGHYKRLLEARLPSIILLDFHLPFASGAEIISLLRSDERWRDIPVILMTADIAKAKVLEKQVAMVLIKPVGVSRIQEAARKIVSEKDSGEAS